MAKPVQQQKTVVFGSIRKNNNTELSMNILAKATSWLTNPKLAELPINSFYFSDQENYDTPVEILDKVSSFMASRGNVRVDFYYKISDADIAAVKNGGKMNFARYDALKKRFNPKRVGVDQECGGTDRSKGQVDDVSYVLIAQQLIDHDPTVIFIIDTPLPQFSASIKVLRGVACLALTGANKVLRLYSQSSPDYVTYGDDQAKNGQLIQDYFSLLQGDIYSNDWLPSWEPDISRPSKVTVKRGLIPRFPNFKEIFDTQVHAEDADQAGYKIRDNANGNYWCGKQTEFFHVNTENFNGISIMQGGSLFNRDGSGNALFNSFKRLAPLYAGGQYKNITSLTLPLFPGCSGVGYDDGAGGRAVLINNNATSGYLVPASDLGQNVTELFIDRGWALLKGSAPTNESFPVSSVDIKPNSVTVARYKAKVVAAS